MFETKVAEKIKTHISCTINFFGKLFCLASALLQSRLEYSSLSLPAASDWGGGTRGKAVLRAVAMQGAAAPCYTAPSSRLLVPSSPQVRRQPVKMDDHHLRPGMPLNPVHNVIDAGDDCVRTFPACL